MARDDLDIPMAAHAGTAGGQGSSWRVSRQHALMDPATRRLLLIAGGVGGTLLLLVGAYALGGRHGGGIPVVEADRRPLREKPANPGGLEIAGADDAIMGGSAGKDGMAPPPETPAPGALLAQERAASAAASAAAMAAAPAKPAAPAAAPPSAPAAPPAEGKPALAARLAPPARPAAPAPSAALAATTTASAPAAAAPQAAPAGAGGMQVQLAALPTEQAAMSEWQRLAKKMPDVLGTRHPAVSRTERDGKTYFRLRTGGFSDVAQATAFCQRVREKGTGCSIATF